MGAKTVVAAAAVKAISNNSNQLEVALVLAALQKFDGSTTCYPPPESKLRDPAQIRYTLHLNFKNISTHTQYFIQWNAENQTFESRTTLKSERNGLPIPGRSDFGHSGCSNQPLTSSNEKKATRLDNFGNLGS